MKISVIIPVHNEEDTLRACLISLGEQNRPADEIIVVDNDSKDASVAIAKEFKNVRIITEHQIGIWPARATGNDAANGDIIVHTDADATFPNNWLSTIEQQFAEKDIIAVTGPGAFYDGALIMNVLGKYIYMKPYFFFVGSALCSPPLFGSNFALRKAIWKEVRCDIHKDTSFTHDDIDLSYHIAGLGKIHYSKEIENYISIRPFYSFTGMIKRYGKGFKTVMMHWKKQSPPILLARRLLRR